MRSSSVSNGTLSPNHTNQKEASGTRSGNELISDFPTTTFPSFHPLDARISLLQQTAAFEQQTTSNSCARRQQWKQAVTNKKHKSSRNKHPLCQQRGAIPADPQDPANLWQESAKSLSYTGNHVPHLLHDMEEMKEPEQELRMASQSLDSRTQNSDPQSDEMLRILRFMIRKQEADELQAQRVMEWRLLALAIDKILFWVFLSVTLASSTLFLLYIPIQRRGLGFLFG